MCDKDNHKWVYLKTKPEVVRPPEGGRYRIEVEVFYCEKCLETKTIKV